MVDLIELLFFAYRDFISDPDAILAKSEFRPRASSRAALRRPQSRPDGGRPPRHPEDHQAEPRARAEGAGRFRLHRAAHRAAGSPPAAALRDALRPGAVASLSAPQERRIKAALAAARPRRPRHRDGVPVRHDQRAGAPEGGASWSTRRTASDERRPAAGLEALARRRAAPPRRRRRHAHPHAAHALPGRQRFSRHGCGIGRGGAPANRRHRLRSAGRRRDDAGRERAGIHRGAAARPRRCRSSC